MRRFWSTVAIIAAVLLTSSACGRPATQPSGAEAALGRGFVLLDQGKYNDAWPMLETALAQPGLQPQLRLTAARAISVTSMQTAHQAPKAERDAHYARALKWARVWQELDKEPLEPHRISAESLWKLGDYDGARAELEAMSRRWPQESYWAIIGISTIDRERGRYAESLADLDRIVEERGPRQGMPFHYHRAAALMLIGRSAEAVKEIDEGLVSQPGYGWAYVRRACANAQIRNFDQAIADQRLAREMLRALPANNLQEEVLKAGQLRRIDTMLDAYVAAKAGEQVPAGGPGNCVKVVISDEPVRSPSPFLAKAR